MRDPTYRNVSSSSVPFRRCERAGRCWSSSVCGGCARWKFRARLARTCPLFHLASVSFPFQGRPPLSVDIEVLHTVLSQHSFLRFPCWASVRADLLGNSRYFRDSSWVRRFSRPAFPCGPSFLRCAAEVSRVTGLSLVPAFTVCLVLYILLCLFPLPVIITAMLVFRTGGFS